MCWGASQGKTLGDTGLFMLSQISMDRSESLFSRHFMAMLEMAPENGFPKGQRWKEGSAEMAHESYDYHRRSSSWWEGHTKQAVTLPIRLMPQVPERCRSARGR